jgi:hypothetical protein
VSHIGDSKLFAIGDSLVQLQKRGWCHIARYRAKEIEIIVDTLNKLGYTIEVDTTLEQVTRVFIVEN